MRLTMPKGLVSNCSYIVNTALEKTNKKYRNNPIKLADYEDKSFRVCKFVLRVNDSYSVPARKSASGRHMPCVSWQAHKEFMQHLFDLVPDLRIKTGLAIYKGVQDFTNKFEATAHKNIGSAMEPAYMPQLAIKKRG